MNNYYVKTFLAIITALVIAGCGGGGGGGTTPIVDSPGITLTVGADTVTESEPKTLGEVTINAKLDEGATIQVFNFATGDLVASGTIGSNGFGNVTVPSGLSVAIVVTGERSGKDYRLSTIIPTVSMADTTVIAGPATTIAAEAVSAAHYKTGTVIDAETFEAVKAEAESYLTDNPGADVSLGAGLVSGTTFGAEGNLDSTKLAAVIEKGAEDIDNSLVKAKNAVQQMKEVGLPWASIVSVESPSIEAVFNECANAIDESAIDTVGEKYEQLGSRMAKLLMPAIEGDLFGPVQYDYGNTIFDLEVGKGYIATLHEDPWGWSWIEIAEEPTYNVANQITIKLAADGGTYTVKATMPELTEWNVVQTFTGDSQMKYEATVPIVEAVNDANPTITASVSIKDKYITTPIEFNGTLSAVGADKSSYTSIQFNGTLTSAEVTATGNFVANFPSALPSGADTGDSIYNFPSSFTMSNASCTVTVGTMSATITGDISVTGQVVQIKDIAESRPKTVSLSNGSISVSSGNKSVELKGNISATASSQVADDGDILPVELKVTGLSLTATSGTHEIIASGSLTANAQVKTGSDGKQSVPYYVKLTGGYSNSETDLAFSGTIEATWDNPSADATPDTAKGSVTIDGHITREGYRAYDADLAFNLDGAGNATCTVTKLGWGNAYLTGSASAVFDAEGDAQNEHLELTNQNDVKFTIGSELVGNVSVGATEVAQTSRENGMLKITFTDSTHEYLPG